MRILIILLFFPILSNCQSENIIKEYPDHIGNIEFDPVKDNEDFRPCNSQKVYQYYNIGNGKQYKGEKYELEKIFFNNYKNLNIKGESGLIRIRFIVNCNGETDRFRIISMDKNYQFINFNKNITNQLLTISKNLKDWIPNNKYDYYQYLIFKIENGNLIEILP